MSILEFHDRILLWFVQQALYAWPWTSVLVFFMLLFCLPAHRRTAQAVRWTAIVFGLACLAFYDPWREAPQLACFLIASLAYMFLRWVLWRLPSQVAGGASPQGTAARALLRWEARVAPQFAWVSRVVRDYLRADPRGVYWFDLARAVRGLPAVRTPTDRRAVVFDASQLPLWRRRLWQAVFRVVEMRIRLYQWLPRYWHRPFPSGISQAGHGGLELDEPHIRHVLDGERHTADRMMTELWDGSSLDDYLTRDSVTRRESLRLAGLWGRKLFRHREAINEYLTFRTPWQPKETGLLPAALEVYSTWCQRRQYDVLWHSDSRSVLEPNLDATEERVHAAELLPAAAAVVSENAAADSEAEQFLIPLEATLEHEAGADATAVDAQHPPKKNKGAANPPSFAPAAVDPDSDEDFFRVTSATDEAATEAQVHEVGRDFAAGLPKRERDRLHDLQLASRILEACLGVTPTGDFVQDVNQVERFLVQNSLMTAAVMVLMLYCLRRDYCGKRVDRLKIELVLRLRDRFRALVAQGTKHDAHGVFNGMLIDFLSERGDYSQIVENLGSRGANNSYELKLLADAETALARQLTGQDEWRDMLRYDAIGHYFQAGFRGLWTLEIANQLLGNVDSFETYVELLRNHRVDLSAPTTKDIGDTRRVSTPVEKPARQPARQQTRKRTPQLKVKLVSKRVSEPNQNEYPIDFVVPKTVELKRQDPSMPKDLLKFRELNGQLELADETGTGNLRINRGSPLREAVVKEGDQVWFSEYLLKIVEIKKIVRDST